MRCAALETASIPANASIFEPAPERDRHVAVLYFHGGGLVYGERDDLPACYVELFLQRGYTLYCLDYPLAPEAPLARIHDGVLDAWRWFIEGDFREHGFEGYALFGRSAGAYLALRLAARVRDVPDAVQPCALIDFYGFPDVGDRFLAETPPSFRTLPAVGPACMERLAGRAPTAHGPKATRFSLYVHVRQTGTWREALGVLPGEEARFSCSAEDIAALPPLFIAASTDDEDVPYRVSKALYRTAARARMKTVYGLEHDFDRTTTNPAGREAYAELLDWLDGVTANVAR